MFEIISAQEVIKPRREVNRIFIHCSASDASGSVYEGAGLAKTIDKWHKDRGWQGVGYHYLIDKSGQLITGRDIEKSPAAQAGHNYGTIAIMLHGLNIHKFTATELSTLKEFCIEYNELYRGHITFHGHCEVSAKSCPVIDYASLLNLDESGFLGI